MLRLEEQVQPLLTEIMQTMQVPGMVVGVWGDDIPTTLVVIGTDAGGQALERDSLFPVTSITKLAVALSILRLCDQGAVELDAPLRRYLPEAQAATPDITLRMLLSHTSGLPTYGWPEALAPYGPSLTWAQIAQASLHVAPVRPPVQRVVYAGADANLLALVAEKITRLPFPEVLQAHVFHPLGIEGYFAHDPPRPPAQIAPATGDPLEPWNSPFWRSIGFPGSGLVTTADGVLRLLGAFLGHPSDYLREEIRLEATRNQTGQLSGGVEGWFEHTPCPWGLGPGLLGSFPNAPQAASPTSFGHSGASGCLGWADPEEKGAWAILSTRAAADRWPDTAFPRIGAACLAVIRSAHRA